MDHTLALIGRIHQGDKEARDTLFSENMGLVYSVARRFLGRGVEMEDLFQIGSIGLLKAVDHFNPEFDVKFSTYAVPMIIGEIKRFLRDFSVPINPLTRVTVLPPRPFFSMLTRNFCCFLSGVAVSSSSPCS